jgi:hypothetical protein
VAEPVAILNNIEVKPTGICERDHLHLQRLAFVPQQGIQRLEIARGFVAERQLLQLLLGGLLVWAGVHLFWPLLLMVLGSPEPAGRAAFGGFFLGSFGVIVFAGALRRGLHLRIETSAGTRKLIVRGQHELPERDQFLVDARRVLGLE